MWCVQITVGDFVAVKPDDPSVPLYIGKVMYLYQTAEKLSKDQKMAHIMWLKSVFISVALKDFWLMDLSIAADEYQWL